MTCPACGSSRLVPPDPCPDCGHDGPEPCDICGFEVVEERECKLVCPNCGYRRDCSDP